MDRQMDGRTDGRTDASKRQTSIIIILPSKRSISLRLLITEALDGRMYGRTYGRMNGQTERRMDGRTEKRTDGRTNGRTDFQTHTKRHTSYK